MPRWTFVTTDLLTGRVLGAVELGSMYWEEIFNAPGSSLATARFDVSTTTPENFKSWGSALWAFDDGTPVWSGIVGKVQLRGNTRVASVPTIGWFEYYRNRFLRGASGMSYGTLINGGLDIHWEEVDQFRIFKDCIDHAHSFDDGDVGVGVTWDALSGVLRSATWSKASTKRIGELLEEYMVSQDGFTYRQIYGVAADTPFVQFKLEYPLHGEQLEYPLIFQPEYVRQETIAVQKAVDIGGTSGDYASAGDATGVTNDLDVTVKYEPDDWSPASIETLRSKWGDAGNRSWRFQLLTTGFLRLEWTEDGTTIQQEDSDYAVSFADGEPGVVRVTMDVDYDGSDYLVLFYEVAEDGTLTALSDPPDDPYETSYSVLY